MRILLVKPHLPLLVAHRLHALLHLEPLELEIVAGGLSGANREIRILDLSHSKRPEDNFSREIRGFAPELIGFTAYSNQAKGVLALAETAKHWNPDTTIIVGGVHATIAPEYFKGCHNIDAVVRGEGGIVVAEIAESVEAGDPLPESDAIIPVHSPRFAELAQKPPPPLPDYSKVPSPRRDLVDPSKYHCVWAGEPGEKMETIFPNVATVRTSVGCPHQCSFCVVHYLANGKYVRRSPEDVVEEVAQLEQDHVYFVDDEMFIDVARVKRIAELLLERGVSKRYVSWARSDTIAKHPDLFALWKKAGLSTLYVGLESMDGATLEKYNKGCDPGVNRRAVDILSELGICLHAAFMVRPEFEEKDFIDLRKTVESIGMAEVTFTVFSPSPGTKLWTKHKNEFIADDPYLFYDCMHTLLPTTLPLNRFYRYFSLLSLFALRNNPWRARKVKVPLGDLARLFLAGMRYGWAQRNIYRDYPRNVARGIQTTANIAPKTHRDNPKQDLTKSQ